MRTPPPFRIPQSEVLSFSSNDNNTKPTSTTTNNKMKTASEWAETSEQTDRQTDRVLLGQTVNDQWVSTSFTDFNTLTFRDVFDLFHAAVADPSQTALIVNRFLNVSEGPHHFRFSEGALRVLQEENAGGASEFSEAVSFELMHRLFHASLVKTEMAIKYEWDTWSKKTDYSCRIAGQVIAVSVTRAMKFAGLFTEQDAFNLLYKKLYGCQMSNKDVLQEDRWAKQILHVMTEHQYIVELLRSVYSWFYQHTPELIGNTVVLITLTVRAPFLYYNFMADQAHMQFVEHVPAATEQQAFTTAASVETTRSLRFLQKAGSAEDDFFYGYPTRAEALVHNAIGVLEPLSAGERAAYDDEELSAAGLWDIEELGGVLGIFEADEQLGCGYGYGATGAILQPSAADSLADKIAAAISARLRELESRDLELAAAAEEAAAAAADDTTTATNEQGEATPKAGPVVVDGIQGLRPFAVIPSTLLPSSTITPSSFSSSLSSSFFPYADVLCPSFPSLAALQQHFLRSYPSWPSPSPLSPKGDSSSSSSSLSASSVSLRGCSMLHHPSVTVAPHLLRPFSFFEDPLQNNPESHECSRMIAHMFEQQASA